ncbi:TetR family transcriptional regulator [Micromonospora pisi]|uniref:TetR family transcriptional regulator n=2 Tax=Micromonospora pisi TaxID=589240 RepID=A0A495JC41_9ACTN|nr:TetR family transcriptional regulator [Micromonospora pisi]
MYSFPMPITDLLAQRRPHRADAARNFDAILVAARAAFGEYGAETTLEEVARRAGVGIGTLYRNFPTREDLVEAIYLAEVQAVCDYAEELDRSDAFAALVSWLRRLVQLANAKRVLVEGLAFNPGAFPAARDALYSTGGSLISDARGTGQVNADLDIDDVMRFVIGVSLGVYRDEAQRERVFQAAVKGLAAS